jgi:hypothetical protein
MFSRVGKVSGRQLQSPRGAPGGTAIRGFNLFSGNNASEMAIFGRYLGAGFAVVIESGALQSEYYAVVDTNN